MSTVRACFVFSGERKQGGNRFQENLRSTCSCLYVAVFIETFPSFQNLAVWYIGAAWQVAECAVIAAWNSPSFTFSHIEQGNLAFVLHTTFYRRVHQPAADTI